MPPDDALAGWVNCYQPHVIEYVLEENRALKAQVKGRRLQLSDDYRRHFVAKGRRLGRALDSTVRKFSSASIRGRCTRRLAESAMYFGSGC